jgi:uncharacterized phiE125 gp8 family phage protein
MYTSLQIIPTPDVEVITLEVVKQHLRLDTESDLEDDLLEIYLQAAIEAAQDYCGIPLYPAQATLTYSDFNIGKFPAALGNVRAIDVVIYYPLGTNVESTLNENDYTLMVKDKFDSEIYFKVDLPELEPVNNAVTVRLDVGYDNEDFPKAIKSAILLMVGDLYERREDRPEVNITVANRLLRPYKLF